jgi:hypothetical protein
MNPEDVKRYSFKLVPTISKNPWAIQTAYKHKEYIETGRAAIEELTESLIEEQLKTENFSDADSVIASIKAQL